MSEEVYCAYVDGWGWIREVLTETDGPALRKKYGKRLLVFRVKPPHIPYTSEELKAMEDGS